MIKEDEGNDLIKIRNMTTFQDQEMQTMKLIGVVISSSVNGFKNEQQMMNLFRSSDQLVQTLSEMIEFYIQDDIFALLKEYA